MQDRASIDAAIALGIARFGCIDTLINNAAFGLSGIFEATQREKIIEQFEVNVFGVMDAIRASLPHFRANRAGVIVNISSGAGVFTAPLISLYCASKFALERFSEALHYELADLGIRIKLVEPGGVPSTAFSQRCRTEANAQNPADYERFLKSIAGFTPPPATSAPTGDDVAEVIYTATTDESGQLRLWRRTTPSRW